MRRAPRTLEGWWMLHDFYSLDWSRWQALADTEQQRVASEFADFLSVAQQVSDAPEGASACYRVLGHKADLMLLHMRPDPEHLNRLEVMFNKTGLAAVARRSYSYFSVTEASLYGAGPDAGVAEVEAMRQNAHVKRRLWPQIPATRAICFYPMSKKRDGEDNWYSLDFDRRRVLMRDHGMIGREFADHVTQVVSGSVGLDDWEWGVTLFADDPVWFKHVVYEMRFDEASARYGLFGPFYVGLRLRPDQAGAWLSGTLQAAAEA